MFDILISPFRAAVKRMYENPQLAYTIGVACLIFIAFAFMANQFITIATDAQDRLIDIRVGSIQDVFSEFVSSEIGDISVMQRVINEIVEKNPTINEFKVVKFEDSQPMILVSLNQGEIGTTHQGEDFLYGQSMLFSSDSITVPVSENNERFFKTVRAIKNEKDQVLGAVFTKQSLSEADRQINQEIFNSIVLFSIITLAVMLLFLRHSRIIDYIALYGKLKEVDQLKDDFISMASHELRTPLAVIRGYVEFVGESKALTEDDKKYVHNIEVSAKQLDALVEDMLDVSRIEQNRMTFNFETFNPNDFVKEIVDTFGQSASKKGLALSLSGSVSGNIKVDKNRLKQVLVNIIGNAIKYTPKGEVKVEMVEVNKVAKIIVADTGLGMSAEEQKHLFEKFYRIKSEETKEIVGTGLGLWITKQIVEKMSGTISIESIKGVGTHFIIAFPVS